MSKQETLTIKCSNCGNEVKFIMYSSINARLNPELKDMLISDTLYKVECSKCGAKLKEIYSLLYHDPDKKIMIYGVPPDDVYRTINTFDMLLKEYPDTYLGYTLRVVSSPTDLREKVITLDAGLDDRVVEIYKYLDVNSINELHEDAKATRGYFYIQDGKNMIEFDTTYYINKEMSSENYEFLKKFYVNEINASKNNYIIDKDWAESVVLGDFESEETEELSDDLKDIIKSIYEENYE